MPKAITRNTLFYGDNLEILREYIPDESVDLIYLDPPFNSNRSYSVLFKDEKGMDSEAQINAFDDTWHWNERVFRTLISSAPLHVASMLDAMHGFIGENQMMAYLVMMAARLVELHRVLKPTGSLYLHCDPTASHYLKMCWIRFLGYRILEMRLLGREQVLIVMQHKSNRYGNSRYNSFIRKNKGQYFTFRI